jgi:hypothetical protein
MNISLTEDIVLKIEKCPPRIIKKKFLKFNPMEQMPWMWTVLEGKKIYTYGYCHSKDQASLLGSEAYNRVIGRKNRNILENGGKYRDE